MALKKRIKNRKVLNDVYHDKQNACLKHKCDDVAAGNVKCIRICTYNVLESESKCTYPTFQ